MLKARIAVLVSGGGTNLQALIDAEKSGLIKSGSICLVVPEDIGRCRLLRLPAPEIKDWLRAGGIKE